MLIAKLRKNLMNNFFFKLNFIVVSLCLFSVSSLSAQTDTTFSVSGNCGMCKSTIEAALDVKGIKKAVWNSNSKLLSVSYNPNKISVKEIMHLIAAAGYDTPLVKADEASYSKLHSCCKYERKD
jgi:copper chaperone CopZ